MERGIKFIGVTGIYGPWRPVPSGWLARFRRGGGSVRELRFKVQGSWLIIWSRVYIEG